MRIIVGSEIARANRLMLKMIDATLCETRSIGIKAARASLLLKAVSCWRGNPDSWFTRL